MPELPEVETTVRLLRPRLEGRLIRSSDVMWTRTLGGAGVEEFDNAVVGARIRKLWRRGKFIVMELNRGRRRAGSLLVHLRMSGRLYVGDDLGDRHPHERVRLGLDRGSLRFVDVRKFGRFLHVKNSAGIFDNLGPEPLGSEFTAAWLRSALRRRHRILKPLLLDQSFLAGLGNIYVDEALHRSGLHPLRRSDRIPAGAISRLHAEIRATLEEAIEREGSSFDTFYRTPEGRPGSYQHQFRVYGRTGKPCRKCGRKITRLVVGQRGSHVCTRCQPVPRG